MHSISRALDHLLRATGDPIRDLDDIGPARPTVDAAESPAIRPLAPQVLIHRAILTLPNGTPFSEVVESYTSNVLPFPCPAIPEIVVIARRPEH
jgi:hypothetical protein